MRVPIIIAVACALTLLSACSTDKSGGQKNLASAAVSPVEVQNAFDDPKEAALSGLSAVRRMLETNQDYDGMGFRSAEEFSHATIGDPSSLFGVGVDKLADYKPEADPQSMLVDVHRLMYPVMVGGEGRALITVEQKEGKWRFVSFGDPEVAKNLVRVRGHKSAAPGGSAPSSYFMVRVNSLFLTFLGKIEKTTDAPGGSMVLVPLNGKQALKTGPGFRDNPQFLLANPKFNAENEGSKKANDVFGALAAEAKKIDRSKPL